MIQWVYEAASKALPEVLVATDDRRIMDVVVGFGGKAIMTPSNCASGTERMAYVARRRPADFYVNIQGDEPMMQAVTVRDAVRLAVRRKAIATAAIRLDPRDADNPNAVKVVVGENDRALYFSRSRIPFPRDGKKGVGLKHVGLYVYPRAELIRFVKLPPTDLERIEKLEQLRALYYGIPIFVGRTRHDSIGVDTMSDLKKVEERLR